jgi:hypothetical protein
MPYRSREAAAAKQAERQDHAMRAAAVARQHPGQARSQMDSCDDSRNGETDALASRHCASRVATALKGLGYDFAMIPLSAEPKRK